MVVVQCVTGKAFVPLITMPLLTELVSGENGFCYRHGAPNGALPPSPHPIPPGTLPAPLESAAKLSRR
jgi:hypothetical protein